MPLTSVDNDSSLKRQFSWLAGSAKNVMREHVRDDLQRQFEALLEAAREAGAEAGTWDLPDPFVEGIQARLLSLVRAMPETVEVDANVLDSHVVALRHELRQLEEDVRASASPRPLRITFQSAAALGVLGGSLAVLVVLIAQDVPAWTSVPICAAVIACGIAVIDAVTGWGGWRHRRQGRRLMLQLRRELAALESEIRRMARSRAQLDAWVAQSRRIVETDYWRYRALAACAANPAALNKLEGESVPVPQRSGLSLTSLPHAATR